MELKFSEVLEDNDRFRLNSEFFRKKYLESIHILKQKNSLYLKNNTVMNTRFKQPVYDETSNLKVINSQYIREYYIDYDNAKTGYGEIVPKEAVLVNATGVGTLGRVNINYLDNEFSIDNHINVIVPKSNINPYYLMSFLQCKYGQNLINRYYSGSSGQIEIYAKDFENFLVPISSQTFQAKIEALVKTAYEKLKQSKKLYKEAEELLLDELNLKYFKPSSENIFIKTLKESFLNSGRLDSEYYQPKYEEIEKKIKGYKSGWDFVGNIVNWKKGIEVGSEAYKEEGKDFIRISDFSIYGIESSSKKISLKLYEELKNSFKPEKGDILFTKDGTIGISYVVKEDIEGILSGAFLRLNLKEKYKDYKKEALTLILNSIVTKLQVERLSGGAIIAHLKPSDFEKFIIPILDENIQNYIEHKITKSFELKKESKELLDLAKKAVEVAIEEGEEKALEMII